MPPVIVGLIVGGAALFIASVMTIVTAMLSSRISRYEEEPDLIEFVCSPGNSPDLGSTTNPHLSDR